MSGGWDLLIARYRCADCGAAAGELCTDSCPSAIALEEAAAAAHDYAAAAEVAALGELGVGVAA